jgi:hypothetical protein
LIRDNCPTDADLARIIAAWPDVPDVLKSSLATMVEAASKQVK